MPRYSALEIPNPIRTYQALRAVSRQEQAANRQAQMQQREEEENVAMREILTRTAPETFDTDAFPRLHQINPVKALELKALYQKSFAQPQQEPFTLTPGQTRYGADGKPIASVPAGAPPPPDPFTLSPGQTRYGPDGQPLASVPAALSIPDAFTLSPGQTRYGPDGRPIATRPPVPPEERGLSLSQKGEAERWKQGALADLETHFRESQPTRELDGTLTTRLDARGQEIRPMTVDQLNRAKAQIQKSYLEQIGASLGQVSRDGPRIPEMGAQGARYGAAPPPPAPAAPVATPAGRPTLRVGQHVTVKGKTYTIGKVYPDGSWDPQ